MFVTREEWLREAIKLLEARVFQNKELVGEEKLAMPDRWAVTCGWSKGASSKAIGVCVDKTCSLDGTTHIFIVPTKDNPMPIPDSDSPHSVLGTLVHEMVHAIAGIECGHFGRFRDICRLLGLVGKPTQATIGPDTIAWKECEKIAAELGAYPHAAMVPIKKPTKPSPWVRWKSKNYPKYTVLINTKNIVRFGMPRDWKGDVMLPCDPDKVFGIKQDPRQERLPNVNTEEPDES